MSKKMVFDKETLETIFNEISINAESFSNAHHVFAGSRNSNDNFLSKFNIEVDDLYLVLNETDENPYSEIVSMCAILVGWLTWIRQNEVIDK